MSRVVRARCLTPLWRALHTLGLLQAHDGACLRALTPQSSRVSQSLPATYTQHTPDGRQCLWGSAMSSSACARATACAYMVLHVSGTWQSNEGPEPAGRVNEAHVNTAACDAATCSAYTAQSTMGSNLSQPCHSQHLAVIGSEAHS